jgi:hypothetical protein
MDILNTMSLESNSQIKINFDGDPSIYAYIAVNNSGLVTYFNLT